MILLEQCQGVQRPLYSDPNGNLVEGYFQVKKGLG